MDLGLSPEQELIRRTVREFVEREVVPHAAEWDRAEAFPRETFQRLGPLGLLGALVPAEYGGAGLDALSYLLALEELAYGDTGFSVGVAVHTSVAAVPIVWFGTQDQKRRLLPPLASGAKLGAFAVTEPHAGSDVASIETRAERDGDAYVLNGSKVFITNGSHADQLVVAARSGDAADRHRNLSLFVVDASTPGFERGGAEEKMGLRSSDTARLHFRDARVPVDNRLGAEGEGFPMLMRVLTSSRLGIAAQALGMGRRALDASIAYAKERRQFGAPIGKHQAIAFMLSDMAIQLDAVRMLLWRAASDEARGELRPETASMAKLLASETLQGVVEKAVQIHGGNGYLKDYVVERLMRDAAVTRLYEGTSEIQKIIIGRALAHA